MTSSRPDFMVAGTARSGTTALIDALRAHPGVFTTIPKEPHYLGLGGSSTRFTGPGDAATINRAIVRDEADYLRLFDGAAPDQIRGEGSSSTLYMHEVAIPRIRRLNPEAKIVIMLREPVARAYSAYQYLSARGFETEQFDTALAAEDERVASGWHHLWHYRRMGQYTESVEAYFDAFGREQVGVWFYDELSDDATGVVRQVLSHLGVEADHWQAEAPRTLNVSGEARSRVAQRGIQVLTRRPRVKAAIKSVVPFHAREWVRRANLRPNGVPDGSGTELRKASAQEGRRLEILLERPVPWVTRSAAT
jgi:hypothetical protein